MTAKIWGISGAARAGKDTVAERLVQRHGFVRVGWADPLKRFCQELFDFTDDQVWTGRAKDKPDSRYQRVVVDAVMETSHGPHRVQGTSGLTPRYAMQTLGTEWGRDCYPEIWVEYGMRVARSLLDERRWRQPGRYYDPKRGVVDCPAAIAAPAGVVFSDCRFRNELEAVRKEGGVLVRVKRPGADGAVGIAGHVSEEEQKAIPDDYFDAVISNGGELVDLLGVVDDVVDAMDDRLISLCGGSCRGGASVRWRRP